MKRTAILFMALVLSGSPLFSQEKDSLVHRFKHKYPGELLIEWDGMSGGPRKIFGSNICLNSRSVDKSNVAVLAKDFLNENSELLNFKNSDLLLEPVTELKNKFIITFQQVYKEIPLWNVKLKLKVSNTGQVLMIK